MLRLLAILSLVIQPCLMGLIGGAGVGGTSNSSAGVSGTGVSPVFTEHGPNPSAPQSADPAQPLSRHPAACCCDAACSQEQRQRTCGCEVGAPSSPTTPATPPPRPTAPPAPLALVYRPLPTPPADTRRSARIERRPERAATHPPGAAQAILCIWRT